MSLILAEAQKLIIRAHERARELDVLITVAIVDPGGHSQMVCRMDGAAPLSAPVAEAKAATVALMRRDGTALRQLQDAWPAFFAQIGRVANRPILPALGAVLIQRAGTVCGALGVSGGQPEQDQECAEAGLAAL